MLDYWCEFKILMGIDFKINFKNEIVWNNRKIFIEKKKKKKLFFIKFGMMLVLLR